MQKLVYEYAIVRIVPLVEREEFVNAGVILYNKKHKIIGMRYRINEEKIKALCKDADIEEMRENLEAFRRIAYGEKEGGPIALMEPAERYRWLTAVRSATIQTSRSHPGLTLDPDAELERLFKEMVL